jgi:hypothetical protein
MHAWIFQLSDTPIKEAINEDTLYQGDGTDYDYCAAISEEGRKSAIEVLTNYILPSGMFRQIDETTFEYQGGIDEWKAQWVERIQDLASQLNVGNVLQFVGHSYKLERELKNPLDTASQFYLSAETDQTYTEKSAELMRWIDTLEVGSKIYIGGIVDFHF